MKPLSVHIDLGQRSYDISIGSGLLSSIDRHLPFAVKGKKFFLVTDTNVEPYASALRDELLEKGAYKCHMMTFPYGEAMKSYNRLKELHDWMLENDIHRDSIIVAVGGGVVGEGAAFLGVRDHRVGGTQTEDRRLRQ